MLSQKDTKTRVEGIFGSGPGRQRGEIIWPISQRELNALLSSSSTFWLFQCGGGCEPSPVSRLAVKIQDIHMFCLSGATILWMLLPGPHLGQMRDDPSQRKCPSKRGPCEEGLRQFLSAVTATGIPVGCLLPNLPKLPNRSSLFCTDAHSTSSLVSPSAEWRILCSPKLIFNFYFQFWHLSYIL